MSADVVAQRFPTAATALARVVPAAAEVRPGQERMAGLVAELVTAEAPRPLLVEAPTGTGKSYAYLAPALAAGGRVVVSTATRTLQGQLADQDAPHVLSSLDQSGDVAVLVGRVNYLCLARLAELHDTPGLTGPEPWVKATTEWARTTADGRLDRAPPAIFKHRDDLGVGSDECPGGTDCPYGDVCFAERARERARAAPVVIVNHHVLAFAALHRDDLLQAEDMLVVDEVHALPGVVEQVAGLEITSTGVHRAIRAAARVFVDEPKEVESARLLAEAAFAEIACTDGPIAPGALPEPVAAMHVALSALSARVDALGRQRANAPDDVRSRIQRAGRRLTRTVDNLQAALDADETTVVFCEKARRGGADDGDERIALRAVPLETGPWLEAHLWEQAPRAVLTSATAGAADPARARTVLGLGDDSPVHRVPSPLPYQQSLLYVPDLPAPRAEEQWRAAAISELRHLLHAARGGALCLFSSWARLDAAVAALRPTLTAAGVHVLVQRDAPREDLLNRMLRADAVLFGAGAFWEGVDLPGPSCRLVAIDRIPFPVPGLPVLAGRERLARERGLDPFTELSLPVAARRLAQGAGRLVRRAGDRGVVAVLDPRLATASYRAALLAHLPPLTRTRSRAEAVALLRDAAAGAP